MRALVTGAGGFVGQWLVRALLEAGHGVTGLTPDDPAAAELLSADQLGAIDWVRGDVRRTEDIRRSLDIAPPDAIYHLAGVSSVPGAAGDPGAAAEVNVVGVARLLAEVRVRRRVGVLDPAVLIVGSAEQYGRHDRSELPLTEDAELRPLTVYAATKAAQEVLALEAFRSEGVRVLAVRSFNHSGVGQGPSFLIPSLVARAIALRGSTDRNARLAIGNGSSVRDFLHVEDVVAAYIALVARGRAGEVYNVSSGVGVSVKELAVQILSATGVKAPLAPDASLMRAVDVPALVGDNTRLRDATGWEPTRGVRDIIDDLVRVAVRSADRIPSRSTHAPAH
jgi:GDP-4-dehydro-6-deoxy-D-mannose reductase